MSPCALLLLLAAAPASTFAKPDAETVTPLGKSETTDGIVRRRCSRYGAYTLLVTEDPGLIGNEIRLGKSCDDKKSVKLTDASVLGVKGPWLAVSDEPFGDLMNLSVFDLRTAKPVLSVSAAFAEPLRFVERSKGHWVLDLNLALGRECRPVDLARCVPDAGLKAPACAGAKADDGVQLTAPAEVDLSRPADPPRFVKGAAVTCAV